MYVIRPSKPSDVGYLEKFAASASIGMTNLPQNKDRLNRMLLNSAKSFGKEVSIPEAELYLFVLENTETGELGGSCGIYSTTGVAEPLYFYRIEDIHPYSHSLPLPKEMRLLHPVCHREGPSELCALFLMPDYRKEGLGRLLSLSRFHFIAAHRSRFTLTIMAELRGFIEANKISPFWEGLGRHFINVNFEQILALLEEYNNFLPEILPRYPIYVSLLPENAQKVIGKTHPNTVPAWHMLSEQGFEFRQEISILDGGPSIIAYTQHVKTIKESQLGTIAKITKTVSKKAQKYMISNGKLDFRACYGMMTVSKDSELIIADDLARALEVHKGDTLRYNLASLT